MRRLCASVLILLAGPAFADGTTSAEDAARRLAEAAVQLEAAERAGDRIAALTETVRAYEAGLSALREGLVSVTLRQRAIEAQLQERDAELAEFLALLQTVSQRGQTQALVHPGGALETVQAGLLVSSVVPELQTRADRLQASLTEVADLAAVRAAGIDTLENGVRGAREARLRLADALKNRTDLPPRQVMDEAATEALLNSTETLSAFADAMVSNDIGPTELAREGWMLPIDGEVLRGFNAPDAAGIPRPGLVLAAPPEGLVVSPTDANVRFSGDIPDHGGVLILEPKAGYLIVLTGVDRGFVRQGEIVAKGDPIGLMGGKLANAQENLNELLRNGSLLGQETLYMEVRQGLSPIDPAPFLVPGDT